MTAPSPRRVSRRARATPSTIRPRCARSWRRGRFRRLPEDWTRPSLRVMFTFDLEQETRMSTPRRIASRRRRPRWRPRVLLRVPPPAARSQAPDVLLNVIAGGGKKLNLFMPDFTVTGAPDPAGLSRSLAEVTGNDLTFSTLFSVVSGPPPLPAGNAEAMQRAWTERGRRGRARRAPRAGHAARGPARGRDAALRSHLAAAASDRHQEVRGGADGAPPPRPQDRRRGGVPVHRRARRRRHQDRLRGRCGTARRSSTPWTTTGRRPCR